MTYEENCAQMAELIARYDKSYELGKAVGKAEGAAAERERILWLFREARNIPESEAAAKWAIGMMQDNAEGREGEG